VREGNTQVISLRLAAAEEMYVLARSQRLTGMRAWHAVATGPVHRYRSVRTTRCLLTGGIGGGDALDRRSGSSGSRQSRCRDPGATSAAHRLSRAGLDR